MILALKTGKPTTDFVYDDMMKTAGCNPSYWKRESKLPKCSSKDELALINDIFVKAAGQGYWKYKPCQIIKQIQYMYEDLEQDNASSITVYVDLKGMKNE